MKLIKKMYMYFEISVDVCAIFKMTMQGTK